MYGDFDNLDDIFEAPEPRAAPPEKVQERRDRWQAVKDYDQGIESL